MTSQEKKDLLNIAQQYAELYKKEEEKFPYRLNVIKELHDDENAHSRILIRLLQYKNGNDYVWLKSFVGRMKDYCEGVDIVVLKPTIDTEHATGDGRIDGFVFEENKYAIIIENKIWDAPDQYKQIDRYVDYATNQGVPKNKIFVVYLTKNGNKSVSNNSLTKEKKRALGSRFIPMSFQDDILPWLEEDVLPKCKPKEMYLKTAIYQYIDYLKEICGLLDYQKKAQTDTLNTILKKMKCTETDVAKQFEILNNLRILVEQFEERTTKLVMSNFTTITQNIMGSSYTFKGRKEYSQIYKSDWQRDGLNIHLEWIINTDKLFNAKGLTLVLHIENKNKDKFGNELLKHKDCQSAGVKRENSTTYYSKNYPIPDGLTFGTLPYEKQEEYLKNIYSSQEIQTIIKIVDDTLKTYN